MSRDYSLEPPHEHSHHRNEGSGSDIPRGSRGGSSGGPRERDRDLRDVLVRQLDIPRSNARERVFVGDRAYPLRDCEIRVLATVGAFRVVDSRDLAPGSADARNGDLAHLRKLKLIEVVAPQFRDGERSVAVTLASSAASNLRWSVSRFVSVKVSALITELLHSSRQYPRAARGV